MAADVYFLTPCSFAGDAACVLGVFTFLLFGIRSAARFLLPLLWMCASVAGVYFLACFLGNFCYFLVPFSFAGDAQKHDTAYMALRGTDSV